MEPTSKEEKNKLNNYSDSTRIIKLEENEEDFLDQHKNKILYSYYSSLNINNTSSYNLQILKQ